MPHTLIKVVAGVPEVITLEPDAIGTLQTGVAGYVEMVRTDDPNVIVYANEEGRLHGLPKYTNTISRHPPMWYGTYFICKASRSSEDMFGSFTTKEVMAILKKFETPDIRRSKRDAVRR
jgi:hypothetical protein